MAKKPTKRAKNSSKAKPTTPRRAVVPPPPPGYRDGALPQLPPRNHITHLAPADPFAQAPAGVQPAAVSIQAATSGVEHVTCSDREVVEMMLAEGRMRDDFADRACVEILAAMQGEEMTPELCHGLRMRLRRLADDVHALARVAAAHVNQRERSLKRSDHDHLDIVRRVDEMRATGATVLDAFMRVAEQIGGSSKTVHNTYYNNRPKK